MVATGGRPSTRSHLPVEHTSFVGRSREAAETAKLLSRGSVITLTGPGGVGKSRLALRVAHRVGRSFRDGVWMVELAGLERPDLVPYALAEAMRVDEQPQVAITTSLVAFLRERRVLIVLDNCEHLITACRALVGRIVSSCERVRVLSTSRQRLGVPGEAVVVLSGLGVPTDEPRPSMETNAESDALRLLVERAVAVAPDFALTESNRHAAGEICRRLDGLPLAIELAAVRLASLTPEDLAARLDDRFRLLGGDAGSGVARGRALRTTVGWSYDLLGEDERTLWRRASTFAGGFGLEAAERVCAAGNLDPEQVVDVVSRLIDKSILTMAHGGPQTRYQLLETLRMYGAERLAEAGEAVEAQRRHLDWFAALVSGGDPVWWASAGQEAVLTVLDTEWLNLRAALDRCGEPGGNVDLGLGIAADLWMYWVIRGRYRVGRHHLETLLARSSQPSARRAMALWALGFLTQAMGDLARASEHFQEAAEASLRAGSDRALGYALTGQGLVLLRLGDINLAAEQQAASWEAMHAAGDPMGLALTCWLGANLALASGRLDEARRLLSRGLEFVEPNGETMFTALGRALAGIVDWRLGQPQSAEPRLKDAALALDRIGYRWGLVPALEGLAWVAAEGGRLERAAMLLGVSAGVMEELVIPLFPHWQRHHDECESVARAGLGDTRYQDCWWKGRDLARANQVSVVLDAPTAAPAPVNTNEQSLPLSVRELEVATLAAKGLSNPAIASALFVSVATVKTHISHILEKLGLDSRVQIAAWVVAHQASQTSTS